MEFKYFLESNCNYWGDAGTGVLPICKKTKRILVNKRSASVMQGGTIGVFGGGFFLKEWGLTDMSQITMDLLKKNALKELKEETSYSGLIDLQELFVHTDSKCNWSYHTFAGIVPEEFTVNAEPEHKWESDGGIWVTYEELLKLKRMHFGLSALLSKVGNKVKNLVS